MKETQKWYQRYLQTDHWRQLRLVKLEDSGNRCQKCKRKSRLQVHHLKYSPYKEKLTDLQVLCEECHEQEHFGAPVASESEMKKIGRRFSLDELHQHYQRGRLTAKMEAFMYFRSHKKKALERHLRDCQGSPFGNLIMEYLKQF